MESRWIQEGNRLERALENQDVVQAFRPDKENMPMDTPGHRRSRGILVSLAIGTVLCVAGSMVWLGTAKAAPKPPGAAADQEIATDDLQRSLRLDNYTVVADNGPSR